ncbi:MAG: MFS transporter [Pseudomonadota bacterium]
MMRKLTPFFICFFGSLFYVYDYFLAVSPSVMTQDLLTTFSLDAAGLGMLIAVFSLASTFFQIPAGALLDRYGARILLSVSVLLSGIGVLFFATATASWMLGFGRLLMGIGSPFAFLGALFLATRWFSHKRFALIAGLVQLGGALGCIVGGGPLASLINHMGWREGLLTIAWVTIILSVFFWLILRDGEKTLTDIPEVDNARLRDTFKVSQVWWIAAIGFVSWVTVTGIASLWGVPYLMKVYHWTNEQAGYCTVLFWLGLGLGSVVIGWFSDYIKSRKMPIYLCFGVGLIASLFFIGAEHVPAFVMMSLLFLLGFAASVQSLTFGIAKDIIPPNHFIAASGLINLAAVFTGVIMQPLMGYLMDIHAHAHEGEVVVYQISDYQMGFSAVSVVLLLGLIVTYFGLKETRCKVAYLN